jgi:methionyl-tRNA formyltransferase
VLAQEKLVIPNWPIDRNNANKFFWQAGGKLLALTLPQWLAGSLTPTQQIESDATFTKKTTKEDGLLDLSSPARANYHKYLAYNGWPGTYFIKDGKRYKITQASFSDDKFVVERVIPEGNREVNYQEIR